MGPSVRQLRVLDLDWLGSSLSRAILKLADHQGNGEAGDQKGTAAHHHPEKTDDELVRHRDPPRQSQANVRHYVKS